MRPLSIAFKVNCLARGSRQVLYQTVSDPQQRIAKLTAKDPSRRRRSSGGSSLPMGGRHARGEDVAEQRRTSFPGSPSSQRFGWSPTTPSRRVDDGSTAWGSPINTAAEDVSMESDAGGALAEGKHDVGVGVETSDDGAGEAGVDNVSAAEVAISRPSVRSDEPTGAASADEPELKLYSESGSDGVGGGVAEGGKSELDHGGSGDGADDNGGDGGGGGGGATGDEGGVPIAPLDGGDDDGQHAASAEQRPDSWLQSPGTAVAPTWAGTSSSEDAESAGSVRTEATTDETAPQMCTPSEVDDAATLPTYPPASARDDAAPGTSGIHVAGSSYSHVEGSSDTFFGGPSYTNVTVSGPMRTEEVPQSGGRSGDSDAGSTTVFAGNGPDSESAPAVHAGGSTGPPAGEIPDAEQRSETQDTGSTAVRGEDEPGSTLLTGNVDDTRGSDVPSRRITWGADETKQGPGGRWGVEEYKAQEGNPGGGASHRPTVRMEGVRRDADQADGRLPNDPGRNNQHVDEGGNSLLPETLNSSVESGGGAAALAASGVFDATNTSSELEAGREGASVGDVDSLDGMGVHEPAWAQQHPVRDGEGRHTVEERSGRIAPTDDTRGLIEDLMRQVCSTRHRSAGRSRC